MKFCLVDRVLERSPDRLVAIKCVSAGEEYLADHFPTFPVLPGVLMLECLVQAARELVGQRVVLGKVRALKYGRFVRPGDTLRIEVSLAGAGGEALDVKGQVRVEGLPEGESLAASGRLMLRPIAR